MPEMPDEIGGTVTVPQGVCLIRWEGQPKRCDAPAEGVIKIGLGELFPEVDEVTVPICFRCLSRLHRVGTYEMLRGLRSGVAFDTSAGRVGG